MFRRLLTQRTLDGRVLRSKGFLLETIGLQVRCRGTGHYGTAVVRHLIRRLEHLRQGAGEWSSFGFGAHDGRLIEGPTSYTYFEPGRWQSLDIELATCLRGRNAPPDLCATIHRTRGRRLRNESWRLPYWRSRGPGPVRISDSLHSGARGSTRIARFGEALARLVEGLCDIRPAIVPIQQLDLFGFLFSSAGTSPSRSARTQREIRFSFWTGPGEALSGRVSHLSSAMLADRARKGVLLVRGAPDLKLAEVTRHWKDADVVQAATAARPWYEIRIDPTMPTGIRSLVSFRWQMPGGTQ